MDFCATEKKKELFQFVFINNFEIRYFLFVLPELTANSYIGIVHSGTHCVSAISNGFLLQL